jgi:hypothetical protein
MIIGRGGDMRHVYNGMPATHVAGCWLKSGRSGAQGNCVELAFLEGGVALRDSKQPGGPALVVPATQFDAFLRWVKDGLG